MNPRADLDKDLINGILELAKIVTTAKTNFDNLDALLKSLSANKLIDDPNKFGEYEYKTYFGYVFNYFKAAALDNESHRVFVKSLTDWTPLAALLADQVTNATKDLADAKNFETAKRTLISLTTANRPDDESNLMTAYIGSFENMYAFVNQWNKQTTEVRASVYAHARKELKLNDQNVEGLFNFPFKHVTSLQLHLRAMSHTLSKYKDDPALHAIAKRFTETSDLIANQIHQFNSKAPALK